MGIRGRVRRKPGLWTPDLLPWAQRWETPKAREEERRQAQGAPQTSGLHSTSIGAGVVTEGGLGMFLPEAEKAEARQRSRPPRDWGEEGHTTGPGGPLLPPGQDPVSLRPLRSGALTAPPHRQPEMVNCPHCTERTSEASGERSLRGSRRQRRLSQHPCFSLCPLQSGVGVPLPPQSQRLSLQLWLGGEGGIWRGRSGRTLASQRVAVQQSPASTFPRVRLG